MKTNRIMRMKKHLTQLLLSLLFLVVTAMTCDEQDWAEPIDVPCTLKEVELYHWDNAGEKPKEAVDNKVLKEAYMMEIRRSLSSPCIIGWHQKDSDIYGNSF